MSKSTIPGRPIDVTGQFGVQVGFHAAAEGMSPVFFVANSESERDVAIVSEAVAVTITAMQKTIAEIALDADAATTQTTVRHALATLLRTLMTPEQRSQAEDSLKAARLAASPAPTPSLH